MSEPVLYGSEIEILIFFFLLFVSICGEGSEALFYQYSN